MMVQTVEHMAVRRAEALRHNTAHGSYYMRVGARAVGCPVQVCQPHVVLNLISPVDRHCLKPLCGPGWTGGLTRPVIVERLIVEAHHDRHFDNIGETGLPPELCLAIRSDQWTR